MKATSNKTETQTEIEQPEGQTPHNQATEKEIVRKRKDLRHDYPHLTGTKSVKNTNKEVTYADTNKQEEHNKTNKKNCHTKEQHRWREQKKSSY